MSILLLGSPNSGKTTLFNRLTGLGAKTVNYPGSTVDVLVGRVLKSDPPIEVVDSPGIYSLQPRSPDERITEKSILEKSWTRIVVVVDATQMARQLAIVQQLVLGFENLGLKAGEFRERVMVALTMSDLLLDAGQSLKLDLLEKELGVRVVLVPHRDQDLRHSAIWNWIHEIGASGPIVWPQPERARSGEHVFPALNLSESKRMKDIAFGQRAVSVEARELTRRLDRLSLHPVLGPMIFLSVMAALFTLIFWAAQPFMQMLESVFSFASESILALNFVNVDHPLTRPISDGFIVG
jgi:ferrous iron transport protein B